MWSLVAAYCCIVFGMVDMLGPLGPGAVLEVPLSLCDAFLVHPQSSPTGSRISWANSVCWGCTRHLGWELRAHGLEASKVSF